MQSFNLNDLLAESDKNNQRWREFLRVASLSMGLYRLKAGQIDEQKPHTEDEVYYVVGGRASFQAGGQHQSVAAGTVIYVERLVEHRFYDITEDLAVLVFFAPPEYSLKYELKPSRYRHYKGNEYTVLGVAKHSETAEELVVYRQEYGDHGLWVRPKQMFLETVSFDGQQVPRFQQLPPDANGEQASPKNLFAGLPRELPAELFNTLLTAPGVRIERIVSHGHASPDGFWYDQEQNEWVALLKGAARLRFDDEVVELKPGDCLNIPAHTRHRVEWTTPDEPTIWLAVHYGGPA